MIGKVVETILTAIGVGVGSWSLVDWAGTGSGAVAIIVTGSVILRSGARNGTEGIDLASEPLILRSEMIVILWTLVATSIGIVVASWTPIAGSSIMAGAELSDWLLDIIIRVAGSTACETNWDCSSDWGEEEGGGGDVLSDG